MTVDRRLLLGLCVFLFVGVIGSLGDAGVDGEGIGFVDHEKVELQKQVAELEGRLSIIDSNLKQARQESIDKSRKILALENEVDVLQKRTSGELEMKLQTSQARADIAEKQVARLEEALKASEENVQTVQKKLESAEATVEELTQKYTKAEKSIAGLRKKLRDAEEALKIAEGVMRKAEAEASAKAQELYKVYQAWLPPWAAGRLAQLQGTSAAYWAVHGEPFLNKATEQASKHAMTVRDWAAPHFTTLKTKVGPAASEYWDKGYGAVVSNGKVVSSRISEAYNVHVVPQVDVAKKTVLPYVKVAKEKLRPHVDKAAVIIRPYYEQGLGVVSPHVEKLSDACRQGFSHAQAYHQQLETSVRNLLLQHESSAAWAASKELVTFVTLALLIVPAVIMMLLFESVCSGKKAKKPSRSHKKHRRTKHQHSASSEKYQQSTPSEK